MADHSGKITLHRVPRRYLVAFLTALALLIFKISGLGAELGDDQVVMYVERGLEGALALATYFGWAGPASWIKDPEKSVID